MVINRSDNYRQIISRVLSYGYHVSVFIMLAGLLLYLSDWYGISIIIMKLGLLVLLLTPLMRVLVSVLVFYFIEGDRKFAFISLVVFLILTSSIIVGRTV